MSDHPNLSGLRAFEAAARHSSFSQAAEELGVSPAAISAQVRKLEAELGIVLFHRGHRAVALTEEGERYGRRVSEGFALLAPPGVIRASSEPRVSIDLDAEFCRQWFLPRLTPAILDALGVHLNLRTHSDTPRSLPADTDIAITWGALEFNGYKRSTFLRPDLFAVAAPELSVSTLDETVKHRLLHERDDTWWRTLYELAGIEFPDSAKHLTFSRCDMPIEAAARGLGIAVGDDVSAERFLKDGRLERIPGPMLESRNYHLLVRRGRSTAPTSRVVTWLRSEAKLFTSEQQKRWKDPD